MKSFNLDTTVTVCGGTPQEPINVSNSNDTYIVDTLVNLELPDITVTDSDGTVATVPSMENVVCTPSAPTSVRVSNLNDTYDVTTSVDLELPNINFTDSDGTVSSVPSMESITATPQVPPTPVRVSNINDSYDVNTLVDLELPNINFTNSDGIVTSVPSMEDIVATSCPVKSGIVYERFYHNNSKVSAALYDEGWLIQNGVLDGYTIPANPLYAQKLDPLDNTGNTLLHLNAFGNYIRFTYADGTQSNMDGYTYSIDNLTGLGIAGFGTTGSYSSYFGSNGLIAQTNTANTGGHNDWFGATSAIFWRMSEQDPSVGYSLYCNRDFNRTWNTSTLVSQYTTIHLYFDGAARLYNQNLNQSRYFLTVRIHFKS